MKKKQILLLKKKSEDGIFQESLSAMRYLPSLGKTCFSIISHLASPSLHSQGSLLVFPSWHL